MRFIKKTKLLTIKCIFISTIIDAFLTISLFIPGLRTITSGIQSLKGIKLIGKIFAFVFDLLDGKDDGYFNIYLRG